MANVAKQRRPANKGRLGERIAHVVRCAVEARWPNRGAGMRRRRATTQARGKSRRLSPQAEIEEGKKLSPVASGHIGAAIRNRRALRQLNKINKSNLDKGEIAWRWTADGSGDPAVAPTTNPRR